MEHAGNTKIRAKIISAYAKKCRTSGFSLVRGVGGGGAINTALNTRGSCKGPRRENVLIYGARAPTSEQTYQ